MGRPSNNVPSCRVAEWWPGLRKRNTEEERSVRVIQSVSHLIDADFSLDVLQALLDDADEGSRGNQSTIDVGLADVTLYTKCKRWVGEPWRGGQRADRDSEWEDEMRREYADT